MCELKGVAECSGPLFRVACAGDRVLGCLVFVL